MITYDDIFAGVAEADRRCQRCGKHISELKNFEHPEYSKVAVVPQFRLYQYHPTNKLYEEIREAIEVFGESEELLEFYGRDNVRKAIQYDSGQWAEKSIECADCIQDDEVTYIWSDRNI